MAVKPIPEGFHTITPYLTVQGAAGLLEFVRKAFDATVMENHEGPGNTVIHAQVRIGDSMLMMGDAGADWGSMPAQLHLYVPDCDAVYRRALEAGGTSLQEPINKFYGDRSCGVKDPWGNLWWFSTHLEDVAPEEMARRMETYAKQKQG